MEKPIEFNYPPDVAARFVDELLNNPKATEKERALFEDLRTLVQVAIAQLKPIAATVPAEPAKHNS